MILSMGVVNVTNPVQKTLADNNQAIFFSTLQSDICAVVAASLNKHERGMSLPVTVVLHADVQRLLSSFLLHFITSPSVAQLLFCPSF